MTCSFAALVSDFDTAIHLIVFTSLVIRSSCRSMDLVWRAGDASGFDTIVGLGVNRRPERAIERR